MSLPRCSQFLCLHTISDIGISLLHLRFSAIGLPHHLKPDIWVPLRQSMWHRYLKCLCAWLHTICSVGASHILHRSQQPILLHLNYPSRRTEQSISNSKTFMAPCFEQSTPIGLCLILHQLRPFLSHLAFCIFSALGKIAQLLSNFILSCWH